MVMRKIISLAFVCLLSINFVLALGVSSPYWNTNPLKMAPGETRQVEFTLVNGDAETIEVVASLEEDAGIAEIIGNDEYLVEPGATDSKVALRISIPKNVNVGDFYDVEFSVRSTSDEEGTVQLDLKYDVKFPVQVVEKSEVPLGPQTKIKKIGKIIWFVFIALIIGLAILIIYLIARKKIQKSF
jgi:hypothetical protein